MGYAQHLGLELPREQELMWICRMALQAPVPEGWSSHDDGEGNTYFYHAAKGTSSWEHPSDQYFRKILHRFRESLAAAESSRQGADLTSAAAVAANKALNDQLDEAKRSHEALKRAAEAVGRENDELSRKVAALHSEADFLKARHAAEIKTLKEKM